jgi:hypothetical protein
LAQRKQETYRNPFAENIGGLALTLGGNIAEPLLLDVQNNWVK